MTVIETTDQHVNPTRRNSKESPNYPPFEPKSRIIEAVAVHTVTHDTLWGRWYDVKCNYGSKHSRLNWWEPKEPQDSLWRISQELFREIATLVIEGNLQLIFAVFASKGGSGKTPTIAELAVMFKTIVKSAVLCADFNLNTGTAQERLVDRRIAKNVKLLSDILSDHSLIADHKTAESIFAVHKESALHVLLSDTNSIDDMREKRGEEPVSIQLTVDTILALSRAFPNMFIDTGNGNAHPVNQGVMFAADAAIFTMVADEEGQVRSFVGSLTQYAALGHYKKVQMAPKVICATFHKKGDTAEKYLKILRTEVAAHLEDNNWEYTSPGTEPADKETNHENLVQQLMDDHGISIDKIFLIPYSGYIHKNGIASTKRKNVGMPTLIAYARILVYLLKLPIESNLDKMTQVESTLGQRGIAATDAKKSHDDSLRAAELAESLRVSVLSKIRTEGMSFEDAAASVAAQTAKATRAQKATGEATV